MRIALVIPTLQHGGAERVMSELSTQFTILDNEVHLVLLAESDDFFHVHESVVVHRLGFQASGFFSKVRNEFLLLFRLRNTLKMVAPDSVLSFGDKYNIFTICATIFLGLNIFVSDRSSPNKKIPRVRKMLKAITYRYAKGIVAQTDVAKDVLLRFVANGNIRVIPNPVKKIKIRNDIVREKIILNIGRLVPEKGHSYLVEAFSRLDADDWKLIIIGEGRLRKDLAGQISRLGLDDRVLMPGSISDVDLWLNKASIFGFSSISEGFPNALLEAMAAGLPCVSFDCQSGPSEIIISGVNGFLIPTGDVVEFCSSLKLLVDDINLRNRFSVSAKRVNDLYSASEISRKYLDFILN